MTSEKQNIIEIQNLLASIDADAAHPAHDRRHPAHRACLSAMAALQQQAIELQLIVHQAGQAFTVSVQPKGN